MASPPDYQRLFSALLESMPDPVTIIGRRGETLFQNQASVATLPNPPPRDFADWDSSFVLHSADGAHRLPIEQWPLSRALKGELVDRMEASVLTPRDPTRPIMLLASGIPVYDENGEIEGAVLISRDVTALRRTEQELAHAQRMDAIGQLTGGVAHDFNNILAAITSLAETLQRELPAQSQSADLARRIDIAAGRGADLVRHLLAFARKQPLKPAATNVNALIEELVGLLGPALGKTIEVKAQLAKDLPPALIDAPQLSTALLNLAVNARDAMPDGGVLTFFTQILPGSECILLEVADNGMGIPFDQQGKVFEPFYTTKPAGKGTGLGLSMVYGFVTQSGGSVELRSAPGRGAAFRLLLPLAHDQLAASTAPITPAALNSGSGARVLLVEDDELVRHALSLTLSDFGFDVVTSEDGMGALQALAAHGPFHLLLTDLTMPGGIDGADLAARVRQLYPTMKILITTGHPPEHLAGSGFTLLRKPLRTEALVSAIKAALAKP